MPVVARSRHTVANECDKLRGYRQAYRNTLRQRALHSMGSYCSIPAATYADFVSRWTVAMFRPSL